MSRFLRIFVFILLPLMTFGLGWQLGSLGEQKRLVDLSTHLEVLYKGNSENKSVLYDPQEEVNIALLWSVWRLLLEHYIDPGKLEIQPMLYGAVSGMVRAVGDPYTLFMTPTEHSDFFQQLKGDLEGIGAQLTLRDEQIVVIAPLKGSPAEAAGLRPEDVIVTVDGEDIIGETLDQVVHRIRGDKGTDVTLGVLRPSTSELLDIVITRDTIKVPSVEYEVKETEDGTVGYIALTRFGEGSIEEFNVGLQELINQETEGIILDLRYNAGGLLEGAVRLASSFLSHGKVVSVHHRNGSPENHYVYGKPIVPELPLVVLINEGSASASEIVAGALRDHGRATLMGKKSFGKGSVQEIYDLPGGSSVRISTARWLTPNEVDIGTEGIVPDWEVDQIQEEVSEGIDTQLNAAIKFLLGVWEEGSGEVVEEVEGGEE